MILLCVEVVIWHRSFHNVSLRFDGFDQLAHAPGEVAMRQFVGNRGIISLCHTPSVRAASSQGGDSRKVWNGRNNTAVLTDIRVICINFSAGSEVEFEK